MNFSIFLILLGVIRLVFSTRGNKTGDDSCNVCTLSLLRRKRANTDYTRWYANPETKQEFIVKVLEDDIIPASETKNIAAFNIQPVSKSQDQIIVRGVQVTNKDIDNMLKEYTRFVPPTTVVVERELTPITMEIPPVRPHGTTTPKLAVVGVEVKYSHDRNSQQEYNTPLTRQYAPVDRVSFTRRKTIGELTPYTIDQFILAKTTVQPTRSSPILDNVPIRTSELVNFLPYGKASRSTLRSMTRTPLIDDVKPGEKNLRKFNLDDTIHTTSNIELESHKTYNDLFYNDGDIYERTTKNLQQNTVDNNLDSFNSTEYTFELEKAEKTQLSDLNNNGNEYDESTMKISSYENKIANITKAKLTTIENKHHKRNSGCSVLKLRQLSFTSPLTLHEIVTQLKHWAGESPVAKWLDITRGNYTEMENPIYMMLVDDLSSGQIVSAKKTVMIVAGIQGKDHHAVTAAMYVLYQLIERSEAHSDLLSKFRFWIIPVFNPDGYDYSMTFPHRRQWSKNLRQSWDDCKGQNSCVSCEEFGIRCTIQPCYGVNLDRNFEYQWIPTEELRMEHPCGNLYAGPRQLSEAETLALTHFLHEQRSPLFAFIAFKEGDILGIMYPYSHTKKKRAFDHIYWEFGRGLLPALASGKDKPPSDFILQRQRASQAASAAYSISGRPYVAGQTSEFLPLYAGGIEDWVDGHLGIDNTFTVMMFRPTDAQNSKLVTERVVHEAYAAVDTLLLHTIQIPLGPPQITLTKARGWRLVSSSTTLILVTLIKLGYG